MSRKQNKVKQIILIGIIFAVTTGLLFGGERLAELFFERNPLNTKADSIQEITEYKINEDQASGELILTLRLSDLDNLQATVEPFLKEVEKVKGRKITKVEVESPLAPELQEAFYELSFSLEEARTTGKYKSLFTDLREMEEKNQGQYRVFIGRDFFYVQLKQGGGRYYAVVSREGPGAGAGVKEGGGA